MEPISTLSAASGLAWASGLRLYLVLFLLGLLGRLGTITLPPHLTPLSHDWALALTGALMAVEFFADKIPLFDSLWDSVHTFIRIPAGALLAASTIGAHDPSLTLVAALLGGAVTAGTHVTKASARAVVNTSPEPFTNWAASFTEDGMTLAGLWLAYALPWVFVIVLLLFLVLVALLLPHLLRILRSLVQRMALLFTG